MLNGQDKYGWSYWTVANFIHNSDITSAPPSNTSAASNVG